MCECFNTKSEEIHSHLQNENPQLVDIQSAWSEESLNHGEKSRFGLSLNTNYTLQSDSQIPYDTIEYQSFFILFAYCPFCGEKIESVKQEIKKSLQELFDDLEEVLEEKLDNITVKTLEEVLKVVQEEMKRLNVDFPIIASKEDLKIVIRLSDDADEDEDIELYLESDDFDEDDESDGYTVNIF